MYGFMEEEYSVSYKRMNYDVITLNRKSRHKQSRHKQSGHNISVGTFIK